MADSTDTTEPTQRNQPCLACKDGRMHSHDWREKVAPVAPLPKR